MIHCDEIPTSPVVTHGENPQAEYTLRVFSDDTKKDRFDDQAAYSIASAWLMRRPPKHDTGLWLRSVTVTPIGAVGDLFECVGVWSKWLGDLPEYASSTTGGTARIRFGKDIASGGPVNENVKPPDFGGGIGFQDGAFQGVDLQTPNQSWTITATFPFSFLNSQYRRMLRWFTGKVNAAPFDDFDAGEVRFAGAQIASTRKRLPGESFDRTFWRIQFAFEAQPNVTGLTCNDTLKPVDKEGWQVYWIYSVPEVSNGRLIQRPVAHYVVEAIPKVDFNSLRVPNFFQVVTR